MADPVIGETFKCALSHIEREIRYLFCFKSNIRDLEFTVENLTARRDDFKRQAVEANKNNGKITERGKTWMKRADKVIGEAKILNGKAALINSRIKGWILCSRFSIGRRSQKMTETIRGLLEGAKDIEETISFPVLVQDMVLSTADFKGFSSRVTTAEHVIEALKNDGTNLIGVYGMPGVGKTTLMSAVAKGQKIFAEMVLVTLTQTPDIKSIQGDIANGLDLKLQDEDSLATRAKRLSQRLSQDAKTVIVLDNVWERVELPQVGIPEGFRNCKVVFTTRSIDVCNSMEADSYINVKVLSPQESWQLFRQKAGDVIDSRSFNTVAKEIVKKCDGLPLALVTLGRALRGKDIAYWKTALQDLQKSIYLQISTFNGSELLLTCIKFSYNSMRTKEHQLCFLFCCLFPAGYHISMDQLFPYMNGERLLTNTHTLEEGRGRLHQIIVDLVSSSLLSFTESGRTLMHDIVSDVAMYIASAPWKTMGLS